MLQRLVLCVILSSLWSQRCKYPELNLGKRQVPLSDSGWRFCGWIRGPCLTAAWIDLHQLLPCQLHRLNQPWISSLTLFISYCCFFWQEDQWADVSFGITNVCSVVGWLLLLLLLLCQPWTRLLWGQYPLHTGLIPHQDEGFNSLWAS